MKDLQVQVIGMVWYREADYDQLMSLFTDGARLHRTFLQWQDDAEQTRKRLLRQGKVVVKAYVDPATFPDWCIATGNNLDAHGRMAFANMEAIRIAREMQANSGA